MTIAGETPRTVVLWRALQWVLDTLFVFVLSVVVLIAFLGFVVLAILLGVKGVWLIYVPFGVWIATIVAGVLYVDIWFPYRRGGTTPAMRWLKLRITRLHGGEPSLRDYCLRSLMMTVDGMFFGLVGAALIAFTPRRQRLGDLVARTVVVRAT